MRCCLGSLREVQEVKAQCLWNDIHPIIRCQLEDALEHHKSDEDCVLLVGTRKEVLERALLARRLSDADDNLHCDLVGEVRFHNTTYATYDSRIIPRRKRRVVREAILPRGIREEEEGYQSGRLVHEST